MIEFSKTECDLCFKSPKYLGMGVGASALGWFCEDHKPSPFLRLPATLEQAETLLP